MDNVGGRNGRRAANYGSTPRRFITLRERDQKSTPTLHDAKKEAGDTRIALGVKRALWIIALATLVNVGVAALQWHELNKASAPAKRTACAEGNCGN
jgi:hypothetical protein